MYVHVIVLEVWLIVNNEMEFKAIPPLILSVELVLAFLLALYLLHRYANLRKQNPFATVSTLVVWFLSFAIIFLLPVDVSSVSGNYIMFCTVRWYMIRIATILHTLFFLYTLFGF